jgi:Ni,Fe-hydrogenase I cytochrome b subunit
VFAVLAGLVEIVAACYGGSRGTLHDLVTWLVVVFVVEGVLMAPAVLRIALGRDAAGWDSVRRDGVGHPEK